MLTLSRAVPLPERQSIPIWLGVLVVTALWLLARPYVGLRHDGILYAGQALLQTLPQTMSKDIFFANGSQDSYSIVSSLLATLYFRWGIEAVQLVVPSACHLVLMAVTYRLLVDLPGLERWLGMVALACLSHVYGAYAIFAVAEGFLTARTLAEPMCLAALALLLYGRLWLAGGLALLAAAVHPLVTLPVLVIAWVMLVQRDRRWLWAMALMGFPLIFAALGLRPFDALLQRYDDDWWKAVEIVNGQVLLQKWRWVDWQIALLDPFALGLGTRLLPQPLRRLASATLISALLLLVVSALGGDLFRNVLITQLQLWRGLWVAHWLSLAILPALGLMFWRRGPVGRVAALTLASAVVAVNGPWESGWVFLVVTAAALALLRSRQPLPPSMYRLVMASAGLALAGLSVAVAMRTFASVQPVNAVFDRLTTLLVAFTSPVIPLSLAALVFLAWQRGRAPALLAAAAVIAGLAYSASVWDRRAPWVRYVEAGLQREHPFSAAIPADAQVYWYENLMATWVVLKRPSYMSSAQGAGLLFNRTTAMEYIRRHNAFYPVNFQAELCRTMAGLNGETVDMSTCMPTDEVIEDLCRMDDGPDYMIFERKPPRGVVASWAFEAPGDRSRTYHLYDCRAFR